MNLYCSKCKIEIITMLSDATLEVKFCPVCSQEAIPYRTCCELRRIKGGNEPWCRKCGNRIETNEDA